VAGSSLRERLRDSLSDTCESVDPPAGGPSEALRAGDGDVAVVYAAAGPSLDSDGFRVERIPAWDRIYALAFDISARWVNDPTLRAWIGRRLDREATLAFLFGGAGSPAYRLLPLPAEPSGEPGPRPVSSGARPRLGLAYDTADRYAGILASRIKAELERDGFQISLVPAGRPPAMVLFAHQPISVDPIEALEPTVRCLGASAAGSLVALETASWAADEPARVAIAERAEAALLDTATVVPLVRLHAWLVTRDRLVGVEAGPPGLLNLDRAGWTE
jgi:ABC-type oligopeptide transport system substrate-binding subunit